jgi:hypothetical protein
MMRLPTLLLSCSLAFAPAVAPAQPQPLGPLWQGRGATLVLAACRSDIPDDNSCRAIELRKGGGTVRLGGGYMQARLLWSGSGPGEGPDALVLGESGGSGGYGELFAVTLGTTPTVRKLAGERLDQLAADRAAKALHLTVPFDIEFFNGAPHSGARIVPIPTRWSNGDFTADIPALVRPPMSKQELDFRALAISEELGAWATARYPAHRLFPPQADSGTPITLQALADLILTGHADQARSLLHRAWPASHERLDRKLGGEDDFWKALCQTMLRHPLWTRLGLDRLPQSRIVHAATGGPRSNALTEASPGSARAASLE